MEGRVVRASPSGCRPSWSAVGEDAGLVVLDDAFVLDVAQVLEGFEGVGDGGGGVREGMDVDV